MTLHIDMEIPDGRETIAAAVSGLTALNRVIRRSRRFPPLYESGIRYREEDGRDDWKHVGRLYADGEGDCEDLTAARAAELCDQGIPAYVAVVETATPGKFHAIVRSAMGDEDPSRILLAMEATMNKLRKPRFTLKQVGSHCLGSIELPLAGGKTICASELGFDAWGALTSAISRVLKTASEHPELAVLLPPQAGAALMIAAKIANMSEPALKKLLDDSRATDSQKALAEKVLQAKQQQAKSAKENDQWMWGHDAVGEVGPGIRDHRFVNAQGQTVHPPPAPGAPPPAAAPGTEFTPPKPVSGQPLPGQIDPQSGLMWMGDHWERPRAPAGAPQGQLPYVWPGQPLPPGQYPAAPMPGYQQIPGYPPMYPPLPGSYPPGMPAPWGYDPYGYPQTTQPWAPPGYPGGNPWMSFPNYPMPYPMYPPGFDPSSTAQMPQPLSADEAAAITLWGSNAFAQGSFPGYELQQTPW